jgi:8-oxo-dGTP pyrophosphatase MutT (NUDIX family)
MNKTSYGILCFRKRINKEIEFVLIKKKYTYAFFQFVFGKYKKNDRQYMKYLFNNMTIPEKLEILSMKFENMWKHILINLPYISSFSKLKQIKDTPAYDQHFATRKKKFLNIFGNNNKLLRSLINNTSNVETLWEPPKGRNNGSENSMISAIREFEEETNIQHKQYKIFADIKPIKQTFMAFGVKHTHIFYIAIMFDPDFVPKLKFSNFEQSIEVSDVQFISLSKLRLLNVNNIARNRIINLLEQAKKIISKKKLHLR